MSVTVYRFENQPSAYVELCDYAEVEAQRDRLREALKVAEMKMTQAGWDGMVVHQARAALAETEEDGE